MIKDYLIFSFKGIRTRKVRSWLTMLGIFIGIAAVVSLVSLGEGMRNAITSQFAAIGVDKLTIQAAGTTYGPPGSGAVNKLTKDDSREVSRTKGVKIVAERMIRTVKIEHEKQGRYEVISNIPEGEAGNLVIESAQIKIARGRMITDDDSSKVVVGDNFYSKKIFEKPLDVGSKIKLNGKDFEVIGILERIGNPLLNSLVLLPERDFRKTLDVGDEVDMIVAQVQPGADINKVIGDLEKRLRKKRGIEEGKEDFSVQSAQQTIEALNTILNVVQYVLVGIAAISLLVGGIGIMNTMFTSVLERRREIGIMKSIGARNSNILALFLIESGLLGTAGGIIGVILGVALSKAVELAGRSFLNTVLLQANFSAFLIIGSLLFSFLVGSISGVVPAVQAAKLNPVDALRK